MEATMRMPACYNVLSCEEMTCTEGGANATMSEAILNWIPFIGWYKGITAIRDYRNANPKTWLENGIDAIANDMNKSAANAIRDLGRIVWVTASCATGVGLVVNAAVILL